MKERNYQLSLYERIVNKEEKIAVVGLVYVGMPIAAPFDKESIIESWNKLLNNIKVVKSK